MPAILVDVEHSPYDSFLLAERLKPSVRDRILYPPYELGQSRLP